MRRFQSCNYIVIFADLSKPVSYLNEFCRFVNVFYEPHRWLKNICTQLWCVTCSVELGDDSEKAIKNENKMSL